jgi:hypothetical protein
MSVIMTVILHGAIRRIQGPLRMLSNAARLGRCYRRVIAVPLTLYWRHGRGEPLGSTISCIISRSLWAVDPRRASPVV